MRHAGKLQTSSRLPSTERKAIRTIALLPWGHIIEDFLDIVGIGLDAFCNEMTGGWMFGYVEALRRANISVVLFCISGREENIRTTVHRPTGARIVILPTPKWYMSVHKRMANPYGRSASQTFGVSRAKRLISPFLGLVRELSPYFSTPLRSLASELQSQHCDAILCQDYEFPRFDAAVAIGRQLGIPVFACFQGGDYQRSRLERWIRPWAMRKATGFIIAPATEIQRVSSKYGVPVQKIARIFNPLDLNDWFPVDQAEARQALGIPAASRVAVWHGRIEIQQKGLDQLVEIWSRVCALHSNADVRLLLVGSGRHAAELQAKIGTSRLHGIHWVKEYVHDRAQLRRCLCAGDIYVFPSRHEGLPSAPVEAMACGLPVIAANASGIADIFEGGISDGGIVVSRANCGDFVDRFATALGELLESPKESADLGKLALARARRAFSVDVVGKQFASFLQSSSTTDFCR